MSPRLKEKYVQDVVPKMTKEFSYKNRNEVPRLKRVVLNMGLGKAVQDPKIIDFAVEEMSKIAGQKPVVTRAKKAIANFKLRKGIPIGCKVTLRSDRMYEFLDRFVSIALPRVRDFRGVSAKSFDSEGNYNLGIKEHIIFPEIDLDKIDKVLGLNVTFVTTATTKDEAKSLLGHLGMPFRK